MVPPFRCALAALAATFAITAPAAAAPSSKLSVEGLQRPAGEFSRSLPSGGRAAVSLDLNLSDGASVGLLAGDGDDPPLALRRKGGTLIVTAGAKKTRLRARKLQHV